MTARLAAWLAGLVCRVRGHRWERRGRNSLGLNTKVCGRCGLWDQDWDW